MVLGLAVANIKVAMKLRCAEAAAVLLSSRSDILVWAGAMSAEGATKIRALCTLWGRKFGSLQGEQLPAGESSKPSGES